MIRRAGAVVLISLVLPLVACSGEPQARPSPSVERSGDLRWGRGPALRTPRTEVAVTAVGDRLIAAGGFTADGEATDTVEILTIGSDEGWVRGPDLPQPLHHAALVTSGDRVFVLGGYDAQGAASSRMYSLEQGSWRRDPDLPTARGALAAAVVDGAIHAVGGASSFGGRSRLSVAHEVYDPDAGEWRRLDDLPEARDHLAATAFGAHVYVVGGRKLSLTTNVARLDVYDTERSAWSRGPDMPTARGGLAAAAADGRVFVFGGEEPDGTFEEAEVYDVRGRSWSRAPDLPTPRHGLGAAAIGARIYVVGGGPRPGLTVSGATEILVRRG